MLLAFNPEVYKAVYGSELEHEDEEIEELIPETEADVQRMLAELAALNAL